MEEVKTTTDLREAAAKIKAAILQSQYRAAKGVNREQLSLYFGIGCYISEHSRKGYWGTGAIENISGQLQKELPGLRGFSAPNLKFMRQFYEVWAQPLQTGARQDVESIAAAIDSTETAQIDTNLLDDEVKKPFENPSIGIILCKSADRSYVEFLLQGYDNPMGVATYRTKAQIREVLPTEEELRQAMEDRMP